MVKSFKSKLMFLQYVLKSAHWSIWFIGFFGIFVAFLEVWGLKLIGILIDDLSSGSSSIKANSLLFLAVTFGVGMGNLFVNLLNVYSTEKTSEKSHLIVMDETITRPILEVQSEEYQRKLSLIKGTLSNSILSLSSGIQQGFSSISKIIGYLLAVQILFSYVIGLLIIIAIIPIIFIKHRLAQQGRDVSWRNSKESNLASYYKNLLLDHNNSEEIKLLGVKDEFVNRWTKYRNISMNREINYALHGEKKKMIITMIRTAALIFFVLIVWLFKGPGLTIGDLFFLFAAFTQMFLLTEGLVEEFVQIHNHSKMFQEIDFFTDGKQKSMENVSGNHFTQNNKNEIIKLHRVSLTYDTNSKKSLDNINLNINQGEKVAVVGANGAGKTSLFLTVLGLIEPSDGLVTIHGSNPYTISAEERGELFSCVLQHFGKYRGLTIKENILLGQNHSNLLTGGMIPKGIDIHQTIGNDLGGIDLSGGQWQRIALIRAAAAKGKIVILDEPTSALDPIAEYEIMKEFFSLVESKTVILSSHRLGITLFADRIIVMDNGQIVEEGTLEELLQLKGIFKEMFDAQASLYRGLGA